MPEKKNAILKPSAEEERFEQERERMHRQMLSSVSHDLKTPLAAVIGSLEVYERMKHLLPPEKISDLISTALMEAYRLDNFVTNILDMAKLDAGMVKARMEENDVGAMLSDCIEKIGHRYKGSKIVLLPMEKPIALLTDHGLFCRAIGLLVDNAMKFGGHPPRATVKTWRDGKRVIIEVMDEGGGIPEGKEEIIFSKYTRIGRGDHQNAGTGLGLAIGRSIASLLGGRLTARNQSGGGAVFTLEIQEK